MTGRGHRIVTVVELAVCRRTTTFFCCPCAKFFLKWYSKTVCGSCIIIQIWRPTFQKQNKKCTHPQSVDQLEWKICYFLYRVGRWFWYSTLIDWISGNFLGNSGKWVLPRRPCLIRVGCCLFQCSGADIRKPSVITVETSEFRRRFWTLSQSKWWLASSSDLNPAD